jgi:hypothetical protein
VHAAKSATAGGSGKGVPSNIDCQSPDVSTDGDQSTADVAPIVAVRCRTEGSAGGACENVTGRVDRQRVDIARRKASVLLRPVVAVVSRSEHPAALAHRRMSSGKDVTVLRDRQRRNVCRR